MPKEALAAAATILKEVPIAISMQKKVFANTVESTAPESAIANAINFASSYFYSSNEKTYSLLEEINKEILVNGSKILSNAIDNAIKLLPEKIDGEFVFIWETPVGYIIINGSGNEFYYSKPYLIIIDTAGDDKYKTKTETISPKAPISVIIDLEGNDIYESNGVGTFGAGIMGYGFLYDRSGNDIYRAINAGPGSGLFGVGIAIDANGSDIYDCRQFSQGAGIAGIGILSDITGDDSYSCFTLSQGFGGVHGCGILLDAEGNDIYEANDVILDYKSPQTVEHNTSLSQGVGFGRRAGSQSYSGGIGLIVDGKGDDQYKCGVFGQGAAYWYGVGMLIDVEGDDNYNGAYYSQGASAHMAVGACFDYEGNDQYVVSLNQSMGHSRDWSVAMLYDHKGDDSYSANMISMGTTNYYSIGVFVDAEGNDKYHDKVTCEPSYGRCFYTSIEMFSLGLFIDGGGINIFPGNRLAKPKTNWRQHGQNNNKNFGIGFSL